jgi:hypothetical protein
MHCKHRNFVTFIQRWTSVSILMTCWTVYHKAYGIIIEKATLDYSPQLMLDSEGCVNSHVRTKCETYTNFARFSKVLLHRCITEGSRRILSCLTYAYALLKKESRYCFDPDTIFDQSAETMLQSLIPSVTHHPKQQAGSWRKRFAYDDAIRCKQRGGRDHTSPTSQHRLAECSPTHSRRLQG